jgi:ZIP family zinc transporter
MRSGIFAIGRMRLLRLAVGTVLLVAGMALLVAHGLSWLRMHW